MNGPGARLAAQLAQVGAQALSGWALILVWVTHFFSQPGGLVMWTLLLFVAITLPARSAGSDRDRAVANFASGLLIWSLLAWGLFWTLIDYAMDGYSGFPLSTQQTLMLTATVLFMFSGAFYWILSREDGAWS